MKNAYFTAVALACAGAIVLGEKAPRAKINAPAPNFTLRDIEGTTHSLTDYAGSYVVLEWINLDSPFVKKHYNSGNMQRLQKKYAEKDVVWLAINSSAKGKQGHFKNADSKKRLRKHKGNQRAYLVDAKGKVGKTYGAKTTPHMFVIDPEGILVYAGAIDNKPSTDTADVKNATNYVSAALDAAFADKPVKPGATQPYGCSVKY